MDIATLLSDPYVLAILLVWSMFWKGWGLWRAGNRKEKGWFIAMFILNTLGILPIIYIYITRPKKAVRRTVRRAAKRRKRKK